MNALDATLKSVFPHPWWIMLLRGLAAILFGFLTWYMPALSLATLVLVFGAYAFVDGILGLWAAVKGRKENANWWVLLLWALVSVAIGVVTFIDPAVTEFALLFYIAIWALATGTFQVAAAIKLRKAMKGEWVLALAGISSMIFGGLLVFNPGAGALAVLWLIASFAIVMGVLMVMLSFKLKNQGG